MANLPVTTKPLSRVTALALTERIKKAAEQVWELLLAAHEGKAHEALGYDTWQSYVKAEFDISRGQSYRLIVQAEVTRALQEATGTYHPEAKAISAPKSASAALPSAASRARDTVIAVSAREAAVLRPHLDEETEAIAEAVKAGASPVQAVREAVARHQAPKTKPAEPDEPEVLTARPVVVELERGDIQILVKYLEDTDPVATAKLITERELQIVRRWIGAVVSARQASQPLAEAVRSSEVEPRFKKAAAKR